MEFRLLGPLEVLDGAREVAVGHGKRRALLTLLLLHRNEIVPAERLIDELWDGTPPATAPKGLQVQISQLRKDLVPLGSGDGAALLTRSNGYVLEVAPDDIDVARFERALSDGEQALAEGRPELAAARLREGLNLWRGPPLVDFAYEAFAQAEIARLEELRLTALERRIEADLALGQHREVVAELEALVRAHLLREGLRGQLMLALYRCGRRAEALDVYRDGRRQTVEELGLEPGQELRALEAQILEDSPELAAPPRDGLLGPRSVRRAPILILTAGALLGAAALGALLREGGKGSAGAPAAFAIAANSVVALGPDRGRPLFAAPLPGRPTDLAAQDERLFAVSVDSSALTVLDARSRTITRTVPLSMTPTAVAVGPGEVWVADGRRGLLARLDAGYERITLRVRWAPRRGPAAVGLSRHEPTRVAVAGGAAWVTDGSSTLRRADGRGRVTRITAPYDLDGVVAGAGAVWAFGTRSATVIRVDPRSARITDAIPIVARPDSDAPAPVAITTTPDAVWVLNGNTATVSRIDARHRGVVGTVQLSPERGPRDIDAGAGAVWVANFDGSVTRIPAAGGRSRTSPVGGSLIAVAAAPRRVWLATVALDQQLPGGTG